MRSRRALLIAVLLAVVAVALMYTYTQKKIDLYAKRYKPLNVVVAAKDIPQNTILSESMVELKSVPEPYVEPGAITDRAARIGYISAINIQRGEQITEQKLMRLGEGMSIRIPKGKRAFTIAINEVTGVSGLIRPGDRVDIIGIFKSLDSKTNVVGNAESVTIMQNVQVLSVGRNYTIESVSQDPNQKSPVAQRLGQLNFSNITLLLSPREVMDIALAQDLGQLSLSLRPRFDYRPPKIEDELKNKRSTPTSVTGIKEKLDIAPGPRWLEQRGETTIWAR